MIETGNILVIQEGTPGAVANAALLGVVMEALNHESIDQIYGAVGGIDGLMTEAFIDLAQQSQQNIRRLEATPGMALGGSRRTLADPQDQERAMEAIKAHDIRFIFCIGDQKAIELTQHLSKAAELQQYAMSILALPQSSTNHISFADHSPGYGSSAKALATQLATLKLDQASDAHHDRVCIVTLNEDEQGWLTAAAALAQTEAHKGPILCLPQSALDSTTFVEQVRATLGQAKYAQVVVGKHLKDEEGNYLASAQHPDFPSPGAYLESKLLEAFPQLQVSTHDWTVPTRMAALSLSKTDSQEAIQCGTQAVLGALDGVSNKAIVLIRSEEAHYACETTFADPQALLERPKMLPANWVYEGGAGVNQHFIRYLQPLIRGEIPVAYNHGLPEFARLQHLFAKRLISGMVQRV